MKKVFFLALSALLLVFCTKPEEKPDITPDPVETIESINVSTAENALRATVDVKANKACTYTIRFWKTELGEENAETTKEYSSETGLKASVKYLDPETDYQLQVITNDGWTSDVIDFKTSTLPEDLPVYSVIKSKDGDWLDGYIFQCDNKEPGYLTLCDYSGKVVWYDTYGQGIRTLFYEPETGLIYLSTGFKFDSTISDRFVAELIIADLDGNIIWKEVQPVESYDNSAHHEFRPDNNGNLIVLHSVLKEYKDEDCWGDGFTVRDRSGKVLFTWNHFKWLNPDESDYLDWDLSTYDYVHCNSVAQDSNGDYYITMNWITEVWKVDGKTGEVIYRFGGHGDIALTGQEIAGKTTQPADKYLDGGLHSVVVLAPDYLLMYNNGRKTTEKLSRGVFVKIDPSTKTGYYERIIDEPSPQFSPSRSNVQIINDNLLMFCNTNSKRLFFCDMTGNVIRTMSREGISYRAYWFPADKLK